MQRKATRKCYTPALGRHAGVTLIEIMIAIVILAVLSTIGVPSFVNMIKSNRLSAQASEVTSSIRLARSEAIKRNGKVSLVSKGVDGSWSEGWNVVADPDDTSEVVREVSALEGGNKLVCIDDCTRIDFTGGGAVSGSESLRLCDDRKEGRLFNIRLTGSIKTDAENHGCQ